MSKNLLKTLLWRRPSLRFAVAAAASLALNACAALPRSGPTAAAIISQGQVTAEADGHGHYALIDLTAATASTIAALTAPDDTTHFSAALSALPPQRPVEQIGAGDLLKVTFWEANPTGTSLLGGPGLVAALRVGADGRVGIPYVGSITAAGRTPLQVQSAIQGILGDQGHHIQVAVLDAENVSSTAVVQGYVVRPGQYPLNFAARDLLDLIALAGGPKLPAHATNVRIDRDGYYTTLPLATVMGDPALNVPINPGDQVLLLPHRRFFYALGAVNRPGKHTYDGGHITLAQTLGRLSGLQDSLAAPRGVFIYRRQAATLTKRLLPPGVILPSVALRQVVYRLDMSKPDCFFVADSFEIHPDDIIYVSDAPVADVAKVLQVIYGVSSVAGMPRNFGAPY